MNFAESTHGRLRVLQRNHRPKHVDQNVLHALLADEPAGRRERSAGQRGVRFPERIAHVEEDFGEGFRVAEFERGEQAAHVRD
jgi:hypothetical protein